MVPMGVEVVKLTERMGNLVEDLGEYRAEVVNLQKEIERRDHAEAQRKKEEDEARAQREAQDRRDRQAARRWLIGLTVTILVALIGAAAVLISAAPH